MSDVGNRVVSPPDSFEEIVHQWTGHLARVGRSERIDHGRGRSQLPLDESLALGNADRRRSGSRLTVSIPGARPCRAAGPPCNFPFPGFAGLTWLDIPSVVRAVPVAIRRPHFDTNGNVQMSNLPEPLPNTADLPHQGNVLTIRDLWLRCFALGGMNTPQELGSFIRGESNPTRHEYNLVAVALNEYLTDIGLGQYVPYIEDETTVLRCLIASRSMSG